MLSELLSPPLLPTFETLPLREELRQALEALAYTHPTPVQAAVFAPACEGRDLVVQARTGTGKTTAFGLPLLQSLVRAEEPHVQALILTPTRELALQITTELQQLGRHLQTRIVTLYGGVSLSGQQDALAEGAQLVVGTPGRVLDHLLRGSLDPSHLRVFVLDEADEMLSMGFAKELHAIVDRLPSPRQGLFFSATLPADMERLIAQHLQDPLWIALSSDQVGALDIGHFVYLLKEERVDTALLRILEIENPESALVFCNTKEQTEQLAKALQQAGYLAAWINSDLAQNERERVMQRTREGKIRFLVATDVAARGIDISHLTHVINADFPDNLETYIHRTGRTGRAGRTGTAISLVRPQDLGSLYMLRLLYNIRPIEKQLPSTQELQSRGEQDLLDVVITHCNRHPLTPQDLALSRRLLTHAEPERLVAHLLHAYLAQHGLGKILDPLTEAAAERRGRTARVVGNPSPDQSHDPSPQVPHTVPQKPAPLQRRQARHAPSPSVGKTALFHEEPIRYREAPSTQAVPKEDGSATERGGLDATSSPVEVYLNVGRIDGLTQDELLVLLAEAASVHPNQIGALRMKERATFVEVHSHELETRLLAWTGQCWRGRQISATRARPPRGTQVY